MSILNNHEILVLTDYEFFLKEIIPNSKNCYNFKFLDSFKEGIEVIKKRAFDVIIIDLQNKNLDVFNFLTELIKNGFNDNIIILTDPNIKDFEKKKLISKEIIYILYKPIFWKKLNDIIDIIVYKKKLKSKDIINFDLLYLLEIINVEGKKIIIEIINKEKVGEIFIDSGIIKKCSFLKHEGYKAFLEIVKSKGYKYKFNTYKEIENNDLNLELYDAILKSMNDLIEIYNQN